MRIAIVTAAMWAGGTERVASALANSWVRAGHRVALVTFEAPGTQPAFDLDDGVERHQLDLFGESANYGHALVGNFRRALTLRRTLRNYSPDVTVAFMTSPSIVAALAGIGARWPTVVSERIHPAHHAVGAPWRLLRSIAYRFAQPIVVQTADIGHWFERNLHLAVQVIPNPVDLRKFMVSPPDRDQPTGRFKLIAVGRLEPQKGYDVLIRAFSYVAAIAPNWDLVIYGEGSQRAELQRLIDAGGMRQRIRLAGESAAIEDAYAEADLFVHSARYEGYPNAVQEALAAGKAVVATDCPGATRELLGDGRYGVLVPSEDVDALAAALRSLMHDDERRTALARAARDAVLPFEVTRIADQWLRLFSDLIERRKLPRFAARVR